MTRFHNPHRQARPTCSGLAESAVTVIDVSGREAVDTTEQHEAIILLEGEDFNTAKGSDFKKAVGAVTTAAAVVLALIGTGVAASNRERKDLREVTQECTVNTLNFPDYDRSVLGEAPIDGRLEEANDELELRIAQITYSKPHIPSVVVEAHNGLPQDDPRSVVADPNGANFPIIQADVARLVQAGVLPGDTSGYCK
jgi:hypothetical protein